MAEPRSTSAGGRRPASVDDIHEIAQALPGVSLADGRPTVYQVSRRSFDGHPSVLVRGSRIGEMSRDELAAFVEGAWLSRAGPRAVARWLKEHSRSDDAP